MSEFDETNSNHSDKEKSIYILQLEDGKYYVGKTSNVNFKLFNHFEQKACAWTKKYKPIQLLDVIPVENKFDEDLEVLRLMDIHGIENVRGGSFCRVEHDVCQVNVLTKMLRTANGRCYYCGNSTHFARNCDKFSGVLFDKFMEFMFVVGIFLSISKGLGVI